MHIYTLLPEISRCLVNYILPRQLIIVGVLIVGLPAASNFIIYNNGIGRYPQLQMMLKTGLFSHSLY